MKTIRINRVLEKIGLKDFMRNLLNRLSVLEKVILVYLLAHLIVGLFLY
jgi:hypothetical protein